MELKRTNLFSIKTEKERVLLVLLQPISQFLTWSLFEYVCHGRYEESESGSGLLNQSIRSTNMVQDRYRD